MQDESSLGNNPLFSFATFVPFVVSALGGISIIVFYSGVFVLRRAATQVTPTATAISPKATPTRLM